MILMNPSTPRWIRELDRFIHLKSLLFVHGNVLDLVSYPVQAGSGKSYWTESQLADFFQRYLIGLGYEIVGIFDPVDGLEFATPPMQTLYEQVLAGRVNPVQAQAAVPDAVPTTPPAAPLSRPSGPGLVDAEPLLRDMARVLANRVVPAAFVMLFTSRLLSAPERLSRQEQSLFTRLLKAGLESREVLRGEQSWNNVCVLVCDKLNDLPPFLYLNNPRARALFLDKPNSSERSRFLQVNHSSFYGAVPTEPPSPERLATFSVLTEGFAYYEMLSLIGLSRREQISVQRLQPLCERFKYGITESEWDNLSRARLGQADTLLRERIKGQEAAVQRVLEIIKRARLGLAAGSGSKSQRPRGVLFFAGPTGVGKTELAKGLATLLFGREERLVRFDMSEYAAAHADQKLLGAPPGYVGYEAGGKLTNAIKEQPFSVLLFDEIEKAHPSIFDKFLQILDDGRLTDGQGDTVYFSESLIIFTSNLGTAPSNTPGQAQANITANMTYSEVRTQILAAIRHHFNEALGRPEILNRFGDNFVVFDFIRPPVDEQILDHLLGQLLTSLASQQKMHLRLSKKVRDSLLSLAQEYLEHGGRGIRNLVDAALVNPLASALFDQDIQPGSRLRVSQLHDAGPNAPRRFTLELQQEEAGSQSS